MFEEESDLLMTVLFWHGPVSLSLPSDWKLWECRCLALSGHFCCGGTWSLALSCPLPPPAFFRVWVMVWVNPNYRSNMWRTSESGNPSLIVHSSLKGGPGSLPRKLPIFLKQFTIADRKTQAPAPTQNLLCCKQYSGLITGPSGTDKS